MNDGAPMMYHHGSAFDGPPPPLYMVPGGQMERGPRQYPLELLQYIGGVTARPGGCPGSRRDSPPLGKDLAFGYESDESSLSSNASGSNKSSEKGDSTPQALDSSFSFTPPSNNNVNNNNNVHNNNYYNGNVRSWRGRHRREQPPRPRRLGPERYMYDFMPYQVRYTPEELLTGTKWDTLSQEIWDKFFKAQQTEETFRKKMNLWRYLYMTIKDVFPRYGLYVVGSTMSGFALSASDMDLCLFVRPPDNHAPRHHALLHLHHVLGTIKQLDPRASLIPAKVPILKFGDPRNGLQVDLNCNNLVGIRNTGLLFFYSRLDWRVRPLVLVTKLWAAAHNINDARERTLSSYSLTLMVIHFLQCGVSPAVLPCVQSRAEQHAAAAAAAGGARDRHTLGELFLQMLRYYAHFPFDRMAVSVRAGQPVPVEECRVTRTPKNDPHQWKLLCVEEPFDRTNTARSVYDPDTFDTIVATFRTSYMRLAGTLRLADAWPPAPAPAPPVAPPAQPR